MKVQLTLSAEQLSILADELTHAALYDKLLDKKNPAWQELKHIVQLANAEVNSDMIRQASYKVIK